MWRSLFFNEVFPEFAALQILSLWLRCSERLQVKNIDFLEFAALQTFPLWLRCSERLQVQKIDFFSIRKTIVKKSFFKEVFPKFAALQNLPLWLRCSERLQVQNKHFLEFAALQTFSLWLRCSERLQVKKIDFFRIWKTISRNLFLKKFFLGLQRCRFSPYGCAAASGYKSKT